MEEIDEILKRSQLSITESRRQILNIFLGASAALAHNDIEKLTGSDFDRVTIYRTLQTFVEKGIIHSIPAIDNSVRYALCRHECGNDGHHDKHVHFFCDHCNSMFCMDELTIPEIKLSKGFTAKQTNMLISGTCKNCNRIAKR